MKKLFLILVLVLGFSSASAEGLDVKVGDNIIYSISGDKIVVEVISVKAEGKLFTAVAEVEGKHYMFVFEAMPSDIYNVVMFGNKKYMTSKYFKKDGELYKKYFLETKIFATSKKKTYFTKI